MDDIENFQAKIGAKIKDFQRKMKQVDKQVRETAMEATKKVGADIKEFQRKMKEVQAKSKLVLKSDEKNIGADISNFMRKAKQVAVVSRNLARDKVVVVVTAKINQYQNAMTKYATITRALGEVTQNTLKGIGITLSAGLIPLIAVLGGAIGNLGPMLGVVAGSTFALASAFAVAGIGAVAFGGLAMTNLKGVFKESKKAKDAMDRLKGSWAAIAKETKAETVSIFTKALNILNGALLDIKPMFMSVTKAVSRLTDSLGRAFDSKSMQAFFDYLNTSAGPLLETVTKGIGNFIQGILNMMTAFAPLTETTSKGFEAMGASFATWAAGLGKSEKFKNFIAYVQENMPKIRSIFSDAFQGIINVFAGFAPSSADMMTSLQDMMERFKEWSSTMSQNQGFQNFITYVKENGPKVVSLIGNLTTFLVNLGIALAPLGSKILDIVNSVISWTNSMMENHPVLGKVLAVVLLMTGAVIAFAPHIIGLGVLFGGAASAIGAATAIMRAKFVLGMSMMITSMLKAGVQMAITTATFVAKWAIIGAKSMVNAIKVAAAWTLSTGAAMARAVGSMIATSAIFVAKWVWMGVQSLLQAGRMAAAWFIALGPIGWVIGAIVGLAILVIANWDKIKAKTIEVWNKVSSAVKEAAQKMVEFLVRGIAQMIAKVREMPGKIRAFVGALKSAGGDLIMGLVKGITGKASEAVSAITNTVKNMVGAAKKFLKIKSPSRVFAKIGGYVSQGVAVGVNKMASSPIRSITDMASQMTNAFNPQLAMADMQANATLNTSINRADMKAVQHSFASDIGSLDIEQPDLVLIVDGKELGKVTAKHVAEENNRHDKMVNIGKGRR